MGFFLTLLSITFCYLSPADVVPTLAPYHLQQFILVPALLFSVGVFMMRQGGLQAPQWILMMGFWSAIVMSLIARLALRSSFEAFTQFGFVVCVYFLVSINAFTLPRLRIFCGVLAACAILISLLGIIAYHTGAIDTKLVLSKTEANRIIAPRICGYGILNDPNDFAQFLLIAIAFLGPFWRKDNFFANIAFVFVPASILIYALYLTDSRGAYFGLVAIAFIAVSRRLGKFPSIVLTGVLFAVLMVARTGASRDLSIRDSSAIGRINAWGSGIGNFKSDPLFGVGFGHFEDNSDITAHNSFVLCFAELGFFGYFFWLALLITTVLGLEALTRIPLKTNEDIKFASYVTTVRAALYAFVATSWFLSQTYKPTLYILLALGGALIYLRRSSFPAASVPIVRWLPATIMTQVALMLVIYVTIRIKGL